MSAVESTTRTSTLSSSSRPNSSRPPEDPRRHASDRGGSTTSRAVAQEAPSDSRSRACTRPCGARRLCSRGRPPAAPHRGRAELEGGLPRVVEGALPEGGIDPRAGHQARAVRRRARDEPVDVRAYLLVREDALFDEQVLEHAHARGRCRLVVAADRIVRVIVVVVAHDAGSNQCSSRSANTRSRLVDAGHTSGPSNSTR